MVFEGTGIVHMMQFVAVISTHTLNTKASGVSVVIIQFKLHLSVTSVLHFILDPWDRHNVLVYYL